MQLRIQLLMLLRMRAHWSTHACYIPADCVWLLCMSTVQVGDEGMSLEALADAMQVDPSDIVRTLFMKGIMLSLNQVSTDTQLGHARYSARSCSAQPHY